MFYVKNVCCEVIHSLAFSQARQNGLPGENAAVLCVLSDFLGLWSTLLGTLEMHSLVETQGCPDTDISNGCSFRTASLSAHGNSSRAV